MANTRYERRHRKRFQVRYGIDAPSSLGFTEDISVSGIFIKSGTVHPIGRKLQIELVLDAKRVVKMIGCVQWAKRIPPALLRVTKGGMGLHIVKFDAGEEDFHALLHELESR